MEWIEVTGRTIEDAKEVALDELGVHEAELEYEVISEPRSGLLGRFGRSEARIRARVKPLSRDKPADRRRRRARTDRGGGQAGDTERRPEGRGGEPRSRVSGRQGEQAGAGRRRRRRSTARPEDEGETVSNGEMSLEEQARTVETFAKGVVDAFGLDAQVRSSITEDAVEVDIEGTGLGLLVGPRGVTLAAVEELARAVVQHRTGGHGARLHLDVAGYRQRRREALAEFTRGVAEEVLASGEERALEPMAASDRKVVHDTIAEIDGLATMSDGEDPHRRVVIRRA